jgi:prepilin-type N-terminal cleavage/methylation domain-containing protein
MHGRDALAAIHTDLERGQSLIELLVALGVGVLLIVAAGST